MVANSADVKADQSAAAMVVCLADSRAAVLVGKKSVASRAASMADQMDVAKVVKKVATSESVKAVTLAALMAVSKVGSSAVVKAATLVVRLELWKVASSVGCSVERSDENKAVVKVDHSVATKVVCLADSMEAASAEMLVASKAASKVVQSAV